MTSKIYLATDLGPGDGGKGGVVHKLVTFVKPHTVVKVGGAQGSHGVCTSRGEQFAFSQWGCGTFEGVRTHISSRMVVLPSALLNEADALRYECGIHNPFDFLTIDETALCGTPYHGIASRLKEIERRNNPRGTVGSGVGVAVRDAARFPELALFVRDCQRTDLRSRLATVREQIQKDLQPIIHGEFFAEDHKEVAEEIALLEDDGYLDFVVKRFQEVAARVRIVDHDYLERVILARDGAVVVESSHGVLTDNMHGFHPHTSALRTLPCFTHAMLAESGYHGQIVNIGVTRAYAIRHGAGPMPTSNTEMVENLLPGSHKEENRYQGKVRVGPIDLVFLRYAIAACGGHKAFDGLAITWFDQIQRNGLWQLCHQYDNVSHSEFFTSEGDLNVRHGEGAAQYAYQEELGRQLQNCVPKITTHDISQYPTRSQLFDCCAEILKQSLNVPIRMVSFGPTEQDKTCK